MPIERVWSREETFGAREKRQPQRKFEIKAKDFTSTEQGVPIPVIFGTKTRAGIYITPIFGFRAVPQTQEVGK